MARMCSHVAILQDCHKRKLKLGEWRSWARTACTSTASLFVQDIRDQRCGCILLMVGYTSNADPPATPHFRYPGCQRLSREFEDGGHIVYYDTSTWRIHKCLDIDQDMEKSSTSLRRSIRALEKRPVELSNCCCASLNRVETASCLTAISTSGYGTAMIRFVDYALIIGDNNGWSRYPVWV